YGHHHRYGDMALAYALDYVNERKLARITNYAAFLGANSPQFEVEIVERTSWSCSHGVGRWERDCGCNTGAGPGWNQQWRAPLRMALDWLRDQCIDIFERFGARVLQLAEEGAGHSLELEFLERVAGAKSNLPQHGDARQLYERDVKGTRLDLRRVAGHYAVLSLFDDFQPVDEVYCYRVQQLDFD